MKDDDFGSAVVVEIRNRNAESLVKPGKPIYFEPVAPTTNLPILRQANPYSVESLVRPIRIISVEVVDMNYEQLWLAIAVEICDRYGCPLVAPGHPSWDLLPIGPPSCDIALRIQFAANFVEPSVRSGDTTLNLKDNQG